MLETVTAAIIAYIGTNIDDIFINTLFFAQVDSRSQIRSVVTGKYLGIGALVLISLIGAFGLQFLPGKYAGLLGLIPIALGVRAWFRRNAAESGNSPASSDGLWLSVMLVTMSNGADNIGVYIPLLAGCSAVQAAAVVVIFAIMLAFWCLLSKKLADLPALRHFLLTYKHIIVPVVFIALGVYIIIKGFFG